MELSPDFTVSAKPTTPESRKATAAALEAFVGAILTGKKKPKDMPAELLTDAVQGLRDSAAQDRPTGYVVHYAGPMNGPAAGHAGIVSSVCDYDTALSLAGIDSPLRTVRSIYMDSKPAARAPALPSGWDILRNGDGSLTLRHTTDALVERWRYVLGERSSASTDSSFVHDFLAAVAATLDGGSEDVARMAFLADHWLSMIEGQRLHAWLGSTGTLMKHGSLRAAIDFARIPKEQA